METRFRGSHVSLLSQAKIRVSQLAVRRLLSISIEFQFYNEVGLFFLLGVIVTSVQKLTQGIKLNTTGFS